MELYTSLVRLKQALNGGALPPMTPVPVEAQDVIDPAFTIGFGALAEDELRGLRCPVRGCGRWFHRLSVHVSRSHAELGVSGLCAKLSIPESASLVSKVERERCRARCVASLNVARLGPQRAMHARASRLASQSRKAAAKTVGAKNLRNSCPTQLAHKIIDLHHRVGRTPTGREANAVYGEGFTTAVIAVYGTWNNAIAQCGLEARRKCGKYDTHDILEGLRAYYAQHGALPFVSTVRYGNRAPLLPCATSIMRVFGTSSWPEAMRIAASILDIRGGRYGLPERRDVA